MPRIVELKKIEGSMWAKLEFDEHIECEGIVTLYTDSELQDFKDKIKADIIRTIKDLEV